MNTPYFFFKFKRTIASGLVISLLVPVFFFSAPKKAEALFPVGDYFNSYFHALTSVNTTVSAGSNTVSAANSTAMNIKTFVGTPLAIFAARQILRGLTAQTVNWINTGFKGNPMYVTDPGQFFSDVGDQVAAKTLAQSSALTNALCSPFRANIRLALIQNYLYNNENSYTCTLDTIANNYDSFVNNFENGGWDSWFQITQNSANNPYGSYFAAKNQLTTEIGNSQLKYQNQLTQSSGFLSYERCKPGTTNQGAALTGNGNINEVPNATSCKTYDYTKTPPVCKEYNPVRTTYVDNGLGVGECAPKDKETVTPGSVISSQLNKVVSSPATQLEITNDINQIVSALMTQLFTQVVGGIKSGLRGASEAGNSGSGSKALLQQMLSPTTPEAAAEDAAQKASIKSQEPPTNPGGYIPPTEGQIDNAVNKANQKYNTPTCNSLTDPTCVNTPPSTCNPSDPNCVP